MNIGKSAEERGAWAAVIPDSEWAVYQDAINAIRPLKVPFVLGGAFGLATYTGRWRNTKDLDFFVRPADRQKVIDALLAIGFVDYYDKLAYDRGWIYRAVRDDVLIDIIWGTPNRITEVDDIWFEHSTPVTLRGEKLAALPPEELLFIKLFVIQRDRCDWPDLLNLLHAQASNLNWERLFERVGPNFELLKGLLHAFAWLSPDKAAALPKDVRDKLQIRKANEVELKLPQEQRVRLLDSRPWFAAFQPTDQPMKL